MTDFWDWRSRYEGNTIKPGAEGDRARFYESRFVKLAGSIYRWEGFPEQIDAALFERELTERGALACFMTDLGPIFASFIEQGRDVYGLPKLIKALPLNNEEPFKSMEWPVEIVGEGVAVCYDSMNPALPRVLQLRLSATSERLADIDLTIDQQVRNQRAPIIVTAPSGTKTKKADTARFATHEIISGADVLIMDASPMGDIRALDLEGAWNATSLIAVKRELFNNALELIGLDASAIMRTTSQDMRVDEVESNDEILSVTIADGLNARRIFCDQCRKAFGWDVRVTTGPEERAAGVEEMSGITAGDSPEEEVDAEA